MLTLLHPCYTITWPATVPLGQALTKGTESLTVCSQSLSALAVFRWGCRRPRCEVIGSLCQNNTAAASGHSAEFQSCHSRRNLGALGQAEERLEEGFNCLVQIIPSQTGVVLIFCLFLQQSIYRDQIICKGQRFIWLKVVEAEKSKCGKPCLVRVSW